MNIIYAIVNLHTNPRTFSLTCTTLGCLIDLVIFGGGCGLSSGAGRSYKVKSYHSYQTPNLIPGDA